MIKNVFLILRKGLPLWTLVWCVLAHAQTELYVATNGNDANSGTIDSPLATMIGARDKARSTGVKTIYIRGGRYNFDTTCTLDSQDSGLTISGYQNEKVIFDGSQFIDADKFQLVTDAGLLAKLHANAQGKVYAQIITDNTLKTLLDKASAQLSVNDKMATVARFPNLGFAHIDKNNLSGESINEEGTYENPKGAEFKLLETFDAAKWNAEIGRVKKIRANGYMSADWLKEKISVAKVNSSGSIQLKDGVRYGIKEGAAKQKRLFFYHVLCELDEPGEWYFDPTDSRLYLWPQEQLTGNSTIGVWAGPQCFEIIDGQDIQIKKMTIQNLGSGNNGQGAINVKGTSRNILIAGITFRFIAEPLTSVNLWHDVRDSKVLSCDFYDVSNNSRLYGGKTTSTSVEPGNNTIENCHFTQVYSKDFYGKAVGITGVGNVFKNNLIHNTNGQPVTHGGIDHVIELNELFNVGVEEGDGGAIYGGAEIWAFGTSIKHNFIHHIMSVPSLVGRSAIHHDGYNGGKNTSENVIYKGGWFGLKLASGPGHIADKNVFMDTHIGIRSRDPRTTGHYEIAMEFLDRVGGKSPTATNTSANYIGKMLIEFGRSGWESSVSSSNWYDMIDPYWKSRYPSFDLAMKAIFDNKIINSYESYFDENMFWNMYESKSQLTGNPAVISNNHDINLSMFENANSLNFKFKAPRPSYAPDIPFENIGLYSDEYRCALPDKNVYRQKVKQRFDGQLSYGGASYDYNTINQRLYYNSGEVVYKLAPCLGAVEEVGDDTYVLKAIGETCPDKGNG
ncbi:hypothetical protein FGF67_15955, partial [Tamlana fucoidanivorans]